MQCDYCDSKATVFFTQIIGGTAKKSCLCEKCAAERGVTDPNSFLSDDVEVSPLSKKIASIGEEGQISKVSSSVEKPKFSGIDSHICDGCGFSLDDLKKIGRLGCSQCYESFRGELQQNLGGMHKDTTHVGRVPAGMMRVFEHRQALEKLDVEMKAAIAAEDYEKAADLRDQIEKLSAEPAEETPTSNTES